MGNITTSDRAYDAGRTMGAYLSDLGFNFDFAPVADVLTNSEDKTIGKRSFGENPKLVASFADAVSDGLHDFGVLSTFKHFPGHGAVAADTHEGFSYTEKTLQDLKKAELVPFQKAEGYGIDAVMVAHISLPNIIGDNTPASLSEKMITQVLRNDLQYTGLVVTDALNMGAISQSYTSKEAAIAAVNAGVDLLLMPVDFHEAVAGITEAVEKGQITEERIDESVGRIIHAKLEHRKKTEGIVSKDLNLFGDETEYSNMSGDYVKMIDVSAYQGNVNWQQVADAGIEGVMIRLGFRGYGAEGTLNVDERYAQNMEGAKAVGLKTGVYFHSEATNIEEAEEEARYVLQKLNSRKLELPIAFDLEYNSKNDKRSNFLNTGQRTEIANGFCNVIRTAGYDAMVYCDVEAPSDKTIDGSRLQKVAVWIADYAGNEKPAYTGTYRMWQYSNTGSVDGIVGHVDLNYFYP